MSASLFSLHVSCLLLYPYNTFHSCLFLFRRFHSFLLFHPYNTFQFLLSLQSLSQFHLCFPKLSITLHSCLLPRTYNSIHSCFHLCLYTVFNSYLVIYLSNGAQGFACNPHHNIYIKSGTVFTTVVSHPCFLCSCGRLRELSL